MQYGLVAPDIKVSPSQAARGRGVGWGGFYSTLVCHGSSLNRNFMSLSADRWRRVFIMCEQVSAGDVNSGILRAKDELQALKLFFFFFSLL